MFTWESVFRWEKQTRDFNSEGYQNFVNNLKNDKTFPLRKWFLNVSQVKGEKHYNCRMQNQQKPGLIEMNGQFSEALDMINIPLEVNVNDKIVN